MATQPSPTLVRRRDRQREETRRDLALAALELAGTRGLAHVRVPDIAAAAGVSPRTFNNYFPSKEAAIAWPAMRRGTRLAENLLARPAEEELGHALVAAACALHEASSEHDFPGPWVRKFRALIVREPALYGEYLKAADAAERALGDAIRSRTGASEDELWPKVLAATVVATERAAIRHWMTRRQKPGPLVETVRTALEQVLLETQA